MSTRSCLQGVDICMSVKYNIQIDKKLSPLLWNLLTENFNCIVDKIQHSENGEDLIIFINIKTK